MTSERSRPECDVRSRNALAAGTEQGSYSIDGIDECCQEIVEFISVVHFFAFSI